MDYATVTDMTDRFGALELIQLTDLVNIPPSTVDTAAVAVKLGDAQSFIDGYLGQVYRLPITGCLDTGTGTYKAPPVLTRWTCDLARYYLYDDLAPEHEVYRRYKATLAELDRLVDGKLMLMCPTGDPAGELLAANAQTGGDLTEHSFSPRKMTDDTLRGY
jgi:phage gp36-like protein